MNPNLQLLLEDRDHWRDRALNAEYMLKVTAPKENRKRHKKREGRRILRLVSVNGKSPPNN